MELAQYMYQVALKPRSLLIQNPKKALRHGLRDDQLPVFRLGNEWHHTLDAVPFSLFDLFRHYSTNSS